MNRITEYRNCDTRGVITIDCCYGQRFEDTRESIRAGYSLLDLRDNREEYAAIQFRDFHYGAFGNYDLKLSRRSDRCNPEITEKQRTNQINRIHSSLISPNTEGGKEKISAKSTESWKIPVWSRDEI